MTLKQGWHGKLSGIFCMQTVSHHFRDNDQISLKEHFQIVAKVSVGGCSAEGD